MMRRTAEESEHESERPVTLRTLAESLDLSQSTVSRILNGHAELFSSDTRRRVLANAERLGYKPNPAGKALQSGVTRSLGLVIPSTANAYFYQVARAVEDFAQATHYSLLSCNTDRDPRRERTYVDMMLEKQVDGIIFAGGGTAGDRYLETCRWGKTKVVTIGAHRLPFYCIRVPDADIGAAMARELLSAGSARILCLTGRKEWLMSQRRLHGVTEVVNDSSALVTRPGDLTISHGRRAVRDALSSGTAFDGVLAFSDYAAAGAMAELRRSGVRVPADVCVIGCDDTEFAECLTPTLSSVQLDAAKLGEEAAKAAIAMIRGESVEPPSQASFRLWSRESTSRTADALEPGLGRRMK